MRLELSKLLVVVISIINYYHEPPRCPHQAFKLFWSLNLLDRVELGQIGMSVGKEGEEDLVFVRMQAKKGCAEVYLRQH